MRAETRHSLKQDRFSKVTLQTAEKTMHWTVEHQKTLIAGGIVVLLVILAGFGAWYYFNQQDQKASVEFGQAVRTLDAQLRPPNTPAQPGVQSFTSVQELVAKVSDFIAYYNRTMARPFRWNYGKPLQTQGKRT